ncbi:MAG: zinc ribbon domain-containing protein [Clostridiales bacterium]|jgi:hypothetical protein|nr:zinc ribbon domain-containing protein [Clostridiales bacterium]
MPKGFSGGGGGGFSVGGSKGFSGGSSGGFSGGSRSTGGSYRRPTGSIGGGFTGGLIGGMIAGRMVNRNNGGGSGNGGSGGDPNNNGTPAPTPKEPTRKKCDYCGAESDIGVEKCPNCGSSEFTVLDADTTAAAVSAIPAGNAEEVQRQAANIRAGSKKRLFTGLIVLVVFVVGIILITRACSVVNMDSTAVVGETVHTAFFDITINKVEKRDSSMPNYIDDTGMNYWAVDDTLLYVITYEIYNYTTYNQPFSEYYDFFLYSDRKKYKPLSDHEFTLAPSQTDTYIIIFEIPKNKTTDLYFVYIETDEEGTTGDTYGIKV